MAKNIKSWGDYNHQQMWEDTHASYVDTAFLILSAVEEETSKGRAYVCETTTDLENSKDAEVKRTLMGASAIVDAIDKYLENFPSQEEAFPVAVVIHKQFSKSSGNPYYILADPTWEYEE